MCGDKGLPYSQQISSELGSVIFQGEPCVHVFWCCFKRAVTSVCVDVCVSRCVDVCLSFVDVCELLCRCVC